jgi:hypothetical protein
VEKSLGITPSKQPDMVQKLILIDAAVSYNIKECSIAFKIGRTPFLNKILTYVTLALLKASVENIYFDKSKITSSVIDRYYELALREGNRQAFIDRFTTTKDTTAYRKIKTIQQPTLVLWELKIY